MKTKNFQELNVWKNAHKFVLNVYKITKKFPKDEVYGLSSQFRRAAVSIPANIAEGYAKKSLKDKIRFFNIAEGSIAECLYYIILAKDLDYISNELNKDDLDDISKMLKAYISGIDRRLNSQLLTPNS